jgi:hypothetical protein
MTYKFMVRGAVYDDPPPGSGATRWSVIGGGSNGGRFWYLDNDTVSGHSSGTINSWSGSYTPFGSEENCFALGYGKDSNGDGIYIAAANDNNKELARSGTDVTSTDNWTTINLTNSGGGTSIILDVIWGAHSSGATAGVWMAVGDQAQEAVVYRSTDGGINWSTVAVPSGDTSEDIPQIATNGTGTWAFVHDDGFYLSTDDGASFTKSTPFTMVRGNGIAYNKSNNTWIVSYTNNSVHNARTCSGTDFTTWSAETELTGTGGSVQGASATIGTGFGRRVKVVAYDGKVMFVSATDTSRASRVATCDVNGTTISNMDTQQLTSTTDTFSSGFTDGNVWMITARDGDTWISTDNTANWIRLSNGISGFGNGGMGGIAADVFLPLD